MKRLLLGVFALALIALAFGFALPSDSYQVQPGDHANAIATNATDPVAATDTDVGPSTTAFYTSAFIASTALGLTTTSSAIDPGGGTVIMTSASFGSTNDYATTSRASPAPSLAVLGDVMTTSVSRASPLNAQVTLNDGSTNDYATTTASRASPAPVVTVLGSGDNNSATTTAWWTTSAQVADSAWTIIMTTAALICGALALGILTALIAALSHGGVLLRWSTLTRGHAPTTAGEGSREATRIIKPNYGVVFGAT